MLTAMLASTLVTEVASAGAAARIPLAKAIDEHCVTAFVASGRIPPVGNAVLAFPVTRSVPSEAGPRAVRGFGDYITPARDVAQLGNALRPATFHATGVRALHARHLVPRRASGRLFGAFQQGTGRGEGIGIGSRSEEAERSKRDDLGKSNCSHGMFVDAWPAK